MSAKGTDVPRFGPDLQLIVALVEIEFTEDRSAPLRSPMISLIVGVKCGSRSMAVFACRILTQILILPGNLS